MTRSMQMGHDLYDEMLPVPRGAVRFPLELRPPPGFRAEDPTTWPKVVGRLEYVGGRLLLMAPCGDTQQDVSASITGVVEPWTAEHPEFVVGSNEAGILLGGEVRGAEAAIWLRADLGPRTGGFRRVPPILAVEVAGQKDEEGEPELRDKARWYFEHGVKVVWLVLPETREVLVLRPGGEIRVGTGQSLPPHPDLPGLEPPANRFFRQLDPG